MAIIVGFPMRTDNLLMAYMYPISHGMVPVRALLSNPRVSGEEYREDR
jgi:hypothetical protein